MNKEPTLQEIISTLRRWKIEATAGHNTSDLVEQYIHNLEIVRKEVEVHEQPRLFT